MLFKQWISRCQWGAVVSTFHHKIYGGKHGFHLGQPSCVMTQEVGAWDRERWEGKAWCEGHGDDWGGFMLDRMRGDRIEAMMMDDWWSQVRVAHIAGSNVGWKDHW